MQYFAYIEITESAPQQLWQAYEDIQGQFPDSFAMKRVSGPSDIFPVFHELFKKNPE